MALSKNETNQVRMSSLEKEIDRKIREEYSGEGGIIQVPFGENDAPSTIALLAQIYRNKGWNVHLDTDYIQLS